MVVLFTGGDPPQRHRHWYLFLGCLLALAFTPFAYLATGCTTHQAITGTAVLVTGLGHLAEMHLTVVVGSLGMALIGVIGAAVRNRYRR